MYKNIVLYDDSLYTSESKMRECNRNTQFGIEIEKISSCHPDVFFHVIYDIKNEVDNHVCIVSFKCDSPEVLELLAEVKRRYWVRTFLELHQ